MKAGLAIVLFALMGTILAGSIGFSTSPTVETEYERVSDLNPIVSSEAVTGDELYNPPANQTGWENVTYQTQTAPSVYSYTDPGSSVGATTNSIFSYGGSYFPASPTYDGNIPEWSSGELMSNTPSYYIGGYSKTLNAYISGGSQNFPETTYQYSKIIYTLEGQSNEFEELYCQNLRVVAQSAGWTTGTIVHTGTNIKVNEGASHYVTTATGPMTVFKYYTQEFRASYPDADDYYYNSDTNSFYPISSYSPSGKPIYNTEATSLVWVSTNSNETLSIEVYSGGATHYVKPYSEVSIASGQTATWTNGYSNTKVQVLVEPGCTVTVGGIDYAIPSSSVYDRMLVTIGTSEVYYQGVQDYANPTSYTVLEYQYPIGMSEATLTVQPETSVTHNIEILPGANLAVTLDNFTFADSNNPYGDHISTSGGFYVKSFNPYVLKLDNYAGQTATIHWYNTHVNLKDVTINVTELTSIDEISVSGSSTAYIVNTWVPMDPDGLLWSNPTMNINDYFPDVVSSGARVYISSVLTTGESLTINGTSYTTGDKKILIDGSLYNLNGLGIDYRTDGHVYIVTTNGKTIDLGERTTYVISGAGVWYWSAEIDSIVTTTGTQTDILFAQSPDKNWMVFAFAGLTIIGLVGIAAIGRGSLDGWDWIITIVAIVMALMLVI